MAVPMPHSIQVVRIGTAEIYRQVEAIPEVLESLAIGQSVNDDVRVVLFVVLREGLDLDDELRQQIKMQIMNNTTLGTCQSDCPGS